MPEFDKQDTLDKVAVIISEKLRIDKDKVSRAATLQDLGADSLDLVEIVMKLEEVFGIEINDEEAEKLHNVDGVVEYVHGLRTK